MDKDPYVPSPEFLIEDAVIKNYEKLGYTLIFRPIRRVSLIRGCGIVDLVLFPKDHKHKIALIEAKHLKNPEATGKVVGQLLRYYAHVLMMGSDGLKRITDYAENNPEVSLSKGRTTFQKMCGGINRKRATPIIMQGEKLRPEEIGLYIAIDGDAKQSLLHITSVLKEHHNLSIGVIQVIENNIILYR